MSKVLTRLAALTRRDALLALAAAALPIPCVAASEPDTPAGARRAAAPGNRRRIDVHNHAVPAFYVEGMRRAGFGSIGGVPFPPWQPDDLETAFARLEAKKIILSISSPGVAVKDAGHQKELARRLNEYCAELVGQYAGRLGAFATVPMATNAAAIAETGFALDDLGLNGVCLFSNYDGRYLGDPAFDEYMDYLDRREAIVFLHPTLPLQRLVPDIAIDAPILEFVFETTRAVANMLFTGVLERYPRIRFIAAHLGGTIPFVSWRLQLFEHSQRNEFKDFRRRCPRPVREYLAGLYYEVAVSGSTGNLQNLLSFVPADHILFGSDFPFAAPSMVELTTRTVTDATALDRETIGKIESGNAERLFAREPS
jgi:predicted TIM-barrel fold metal-dependent hydrolase